MQIIEIAVKGMERIDLQQYGFRGTTSTDHYWRIRWIDEDGTEADQECQFNDLAGMERLARYYATSEPVAWRYFETDVFGDEAEKQRFVESYAAA